MKTKYELFRPNSTIARWATGIAKSRLDAALQDLPDGWKIGAVRDERITDMWDKNGKLTFISHGGDHGEWR
jgi:hypothetical protein